MTHDILKTMTEKILDKPVLVVNANYEPLNVCNTKRAMAMLFAAKAVILVSGEAKIRSENREFEHPSVIRLCQMIRRPRPRINLTKREIFRRDSYSCQYCGRINATLTVDHVVPRHLGGKHTWENLVTACASCNKQKGGLLVERANMRLRQQPVEPHPTAEYRFRPYLATYREWEQFVLGW